MNTRRLMCVCAIAAPLVLAGLPAWADITPISKANVPFAFVFSGRTLPAGEYTFQAAPNGTTVAIRDANGHAMVSAVVSPVGPMHGNSKTRLVFQKRDGAVHLAEVYLPGRAGGSVLPVK